MINGTTVIKAKDATTAMEKVVKELVEVPKAYVVKEFVGVPVPTAPEDLPNYEEAEQENTIQGAPVLGGVQ